MRKLKVKIDDLIIPDAKVERFIDLESGLPLSMVRVTYEGEPFEEIAKAWSEQNLIPFESDVLKTNVLVIGSEWLREERKVEYTLLERAIDVPCGYKRSTFRNVQTGERVEFLLPEDMVDLSPERLKQFKKLPFIRFILRKHLPDDLIKKEA